MKEKKLNILIVGGNFIGKGAEAMMFTLKDAINEVAPNSQIFVVPKYDEERTSLLNNGFIPLKKKNLHWFNRIIQLIKTILFTKSQKKLVLDEITENSLSNVFKVSNLVIDISGFASGDQWGWRKAFNRAIDFYMAKNSGNKIVFMPQSWGPFRVFSIKILTKILLKTSTIVFAREQLSYNYLLKNKCVNPKKLYYATDIAFHFKAVSSEKAVSILNSLGVSFSENEPLIAITPNVRIYQRTQGEGSNNTYIKQLFEVIDYLLENTSSKILLISHEFFKNVNDLMICGLIQDSFKENQRIYVTPENLTAAEVKAIIGLCDLVIASRYHSLVAALSKGVVPVVIGWSHKYGELIKLFEIEKLVTDSVSQKHLNIVKVLEDAWTNRINYKNIINKHIPEIERSSLKSIQMLKDIIIELK